MIIFFAVIDQEFAKLLRSIEQFLQTVKGHNNFRKRILFQLVTEGFCSLVSIGRIKVPIGTNKCDGETFKNKLEQLCTDKKKTSLELFFCRKEFGSPFQE